MMLNQQCESTEGNIETYLQWKTNKKSYVPYGVAVTPVLLSDLEGNFSCLNLVTSVPREITASINHDVFTHESDSTCGL